MVVLVAALLLGACASTKSDMAALKPTENTTTAVVKITYPTGDAEYVGRKEFDQVKTKLAQPGTPEQSILDELAARHLLIHEASAKNISADPKEVDKSLENIRTQICAQTPFPEAKTEKDPAKLLAACANYFGFDGTAGLRSYLQQQVMINSLIQKEAKPDKIPQPTKISQPVEEVHSAHILLKTEADAKKARARVTTGHEDFAKVAKEMSIDPSAKQNGGDLGFFLPGSLVPEFEKAAAALKDGEISQPVKTQYGWHIIKTIARRKASPEAIQQAEQQAQQQAQQVQQQAQQAAASAYQRSILDKAKQAGRVKYLITPAPTEAPAVALPTVGVEPNQTATANPAP
jgi:parvulin-like peptidyl-prolyl isomerase